MATTVSAAAATLVERAGEVELIEEALARVRDRRSGELLFVAGEAGVGKTSLLRVFVDGCGAPRVLWGACDPLFTPRPLGPLLAPAERNGDELHQLLRDGALPHEVAAALADDLARRPAPSSSSTSPLGRRGDARRPSPARTADRAGPGARTRELPRR